MNRVKKGRFGEYFVILKLIEQGFDIYPSLVDDRGVDLVVSNPQGAYLEIQIKSVWTEKTPEWFQLQTQNEEIPIRENFFIICLDKSQDCWIFPSKVFFDSKYTTKSKRKKGGFTFDLNLATTKRTNDKPNRELLKDYKNKWDILLNFSRQNYSAERIPS
jgi:hypothetical protein